MKLLLVDSRVQYQQIVDARKDDVDYIVFNYFNDTFKSLLDKIDTNKYTEIGLVQHSDLVIGFNILAKETIGVNSDIFPYPSFASLKNFLIGLKTKGASIFDFLGCNLYDPKKTPAIFKYLEEQTSLDLRASTNLTGNKTIGGDWILESDNVDVKNIYFTNKIDEWKGVLQATFTRKNYYLRQGFNQVVHQNVDISGYPINPVYDLNNSNLKFPTSGLVSSPMAGNIPTNLSGVIAVVSTAYAFAALKTNGSVVAWGNSAYGGDITDPTYGITLGNVNNVASIYSNQYAFAALKNDGSVVTWGDPNYGGDSSAVASKLSSDVLYIYCTNGAFAALKSDLSVVTWGNANYGGNSSSVSNSLSSNVMNIYSTNQAFAAIKTNGSVVTWGAFDFGGDSSSVSNQLVDVKVIYSNEFAFAALKGDNSVITWGGIVNIDNLTNVVNIYSTQYAFAAIKLDGSVFTWGISSYGGDSSSPIGGDLSSNVVTIYSNNYAFAALKKDGSVVVWGMPSYGGDFMSFSVTSEGPIVVNISGDLFSNVVSIYSTNKAFAALKSDGSVLTWGYAPEGGSYTMSNTTPVLTIFSDDKAFIALKSDGSVEAWGHINETGQDVESWTETNMIGIISQSNGFIGLKKPSSISLSNYYYPTGGSVISRTVPNAPTISNTTIGNGIVALTWIPPSNIGDFPILNYYIKSDIGEFYTTQTNYVWTTSSSIRQYNFTIIPRTVVGNGDLLKLTLINPDAQVVPLAPIINDLVFKNNNFNGSVFVNPDYNGYLGTGSFTLSWTDVSFDSGSDTIYYLISNGVPGVADISRNAVDGKSYEWTGLSTYEFYNFTVKAGNQTGASQPSIWVQNPDPNPPIRFTFTSAIGGDKNVDLRWYWEPANYSGDRLRLEITNGFNNVTWETIGSGGITNYTWPNLTPGQIYFFSIRNIYYGNDSKIYPSSWSEPIKAIVPDIPNAPTLNTAEGYNNYVRLSWIPNPYSGNSPTLYYLVSKDGGITYDISLNATNGTSYSCFGLTNGTLYRFAVKSGNYFGASSSSNIRPATPCDIPSKPTLNPIIPGNLSLSISWIAPTETNGSPISNYLIYIDGDNSVSFNYTVAPNIRNFLFTDILSGDTYWSVYIIAVNAAGPSPKSNIEGNYGRVLPEPPILESITSTNNPVILTWTPQPNGGSSLLSYKIIISPVSDPNIQNILTANKNDTSFDCTNLLSVGTGYIFRMKAVNIVGESRNSNYVSMITENVPTPPFLSPIIFDPLSDDGNTLSLSWSVPISNGGSSIQNYIISNGVSQDVTVEGTSYSFTGLTNITYTFQVRAVNSSGPSDYSNPRVFTIN